MIVRVQKVKYQMKMSRQQTKQTKKNDFTLSWLVRVVCDILQLQLRKNFHRATFLKNMKKEPKQKSSQRYLERRYCMLLVIMIGVIGNHDRRTTAWMSQHFAKAARLFTTYYCKILQLDDFSISYR